MSTESNEQPEARELPPLEHEDHRGYMFRYTPEVSQLRRYLEQLPTEWLASLGVQRLAPSGEKPSEAKLIIGALRRYALPDKNDEDGTWFGMGWNACRREVVKAIDAVEVIALHVAAPPLPTHPPSHCGDCGEPHAGVCPYQPKPPEPSGEKSLDEQAHDAIQAARVDRAKAMGVDVKPRPYDPEPSGEEWIGELERLEKAATPGPWSVSDDEPSDVVLWGPGEDEFVGNVGGARVVNVMTVFDIDQKNGRLLAALRNAAPKLLEAARSYGLANVYYPKVIRELRTQLAAATATIARVEAVAKEMGEARYALLQPVILAKCDWFDEWIAVLQGAKHEHRGSENAVDRDAVRGRSRASLEATLKQVEALLPKMQAVINEPGVTDGTYVRRATTQDWRYQLVMALTAHPSTEEGDSA